MHEKIFSVHLANGNGCDDTSYVLLTKTHTHIAAVTADHAGELWLLVGTDSGYEAVTAIYFQSIAVEFSVVD